MPKPDERAKPYRQEAEKLTDDIMGGERVQPRDGLFIEDVQQENNEFRADIRLLESSDRGFPVQRRENGEIVPVALRYLSEIQRYGFSAERVSYLAQLSFVKPVEAIAAFRAGVTDFLATRIASVVDFFAGHFGGTVPAFSMSFPSLFSTKMVSGVGFNIDIATKTSNVRIHSSLTIRRNWLYFGPYTGSLLRGRLIGGMYEFGVDGGPFAIITPDAGTFDIPYKTLSPRLTL